MALRRVQQVKFRQQDANGDAASGWFVHTYEAGLLVEATTYSDSTGTENENPIELDDAGEANIYLDDGLAYRFIIKTPSGVTYDDQDNLTGDGGVVSGGEGYPPEGNIGNIQYKVGETTFGGDSNLNWDYINQVLTLNGFLNAQFDITARKFIGDGSELTNLPLSGFVPYTGATENLDLGLNSLLTNFISSTSQFNVSVDNVQKFAVGTNSVFTTAGITFLSDKVQTPLLNTVNSATPMSLQVGSTEKIEITDALTTVKTDLGVIGNIIATGGIDITGDLDVQGDITGDSVSVDNNVESGRAFRTTGSALTTGWTGVGAELFIDGGVSARLLGFDRTLGQRVLMAIDGDKVELRDSGFVRFKLVDGGVETFGTSKVNGATNFGRVSVLPTGLLSGDRAYLTTGTIGWYTYNGSAWVADISNPRLTLNITAPEIHTITVINTYEDLKIWRATTAGEADQFSLDETTGIYTYNGVDNIPFSGWFSMSVTGSTTNMATTIVLAVDTGSGFVDITAEAMPISVDSSGYRSATQLTSAILSNGDRLKVRAKCSKTGDLTFDYAHKLIRRD